MMGLRTFFWGGIEPRDSKEKTLRSPIRNALLPGTVVVALRQNKGEEALPLVAVGDVVEESACLGEAPGEGTRVHSPVPGRIRELKNIVLPDGSSSAALVIDLEGSFNTSGSGPERHEWENLSPARLVDLIRENGVVGFGWNSRASHLKLAAAIQKNAKILLVNGMESEAFQTADARIMVEHTEAILEAALIIKRIIGAEEIVFALNERYAEAQEKIRQAKKKISASITVKVLADRYPQGEERLLVQSVFNKDLSHGQSALDARILLFNASTLHALQEAVVFRKPSIEKTLTVSGDAVVQPMNLKVRIGTPISLVIEECGGLKYFPDRIVVGGPMHGRSITDIDTPITKDMSLILALGKAEVAASPTEPCNHCGACVRACPVGLEPIRLLRLAEHGKYREALGEGLLDCLDCGICSYECPSRIPLSQEIRKSKNAVRNGEFLESAEEI